MCIPCMAVYGPIEDTGPHKLMKLAPENWTLLNHEECMFHSQICLQAMDTDVAFKSFYANLLPSMQEEMRRIENIKTSEWHQQVLLVKQGKELLNPLPHMSVLSHSIHFQSGMYVSCQYLTTKLIGLCR